MCLFFFVLMPLAPRVVLVHYPNSVAVLALQETQLRFSPAVRGGKHGDIPSEVDMILYDIKSFDQQVQCSLKCVRWYSSVNLSAGALDIAQKVADRRKCSLL